MKRFALLVSFVILVCGVRAEAQMVHTMVQPDRVVIGAEFIQRRTDLPMQLIVSAGQTVELPANSIADYIEVAGTLRCSRTHDTRLQVTTFIVLPSGTFDCGTQADPIPAGRRVEIVIRNVTIDTTKDPFQWGNGLINFGHQTRVGAAKLTWTSVTADVLAGARSFTLSEDPVGWTVGDELLLPDMEPPAAAPRREARVTVAAIAGRVITLSKALDFEHLSIKDPSGTLVLLPRVANLSRNVVLHSEDPTGTPGHTVNVGPDSNWDIRYNEFHDLGRTPILPLDNTNIAAGHIGLRQVGKYNDHAHHAQGLNSFTVGNAYIGRARAVGSGKWGLSTHATSDSTVADNVCVDFPGACFVTEDGNEVRNVFDHNFAAYSIGNFDGNANMELANLDVNCPGCQGNGWWIRGFANTFRRNEVWNSITGINIFNQQQIPSRYPSTPGGMEDTVFDRLKAFPVAFTDNVTAANTLDGVQYWGAPNKFPNINLIAANNEQMQVNQPISQSPKSPYLVNPTLVCQRGRGYAISASSAYVESVTIEGGTLAGCERGISNGAAENRLTNVRMQNAINLAYAPPPGLSVHENLTFVDLPGFPRQWVMFGDDVVWDGVSPKVPNGIGTPNRGSRHTFVNWQGDGKSYQLFEKQSLSTMPAWQAIEDAPSQFSCPEAHLTWGQCWAKYGLSSGGESVNVADVVPLPGLVTGVARVGTSPRLGTPHLVITVPNAGQPATVRAGNGSGFVRFYGEFTGDPTQAPLMGLVSIDGAPSTLIFPVENPNANDTLRAFTATAAQVAPGRHTVRTWRTDTNQSPIGAGLEFEYVVGPIVTPPPITCVPPAVLTGGVCVTPAPTTVTVPNVVGQTQSAAMTALSAVGLTLGTVTTQPATFAGVVLSESPAAGTSVAPGTAVNLVVAVAQPPPPPVETFTTVCTVQFQTGSQGHVKTFSTCPPN